MLNSREISNIGSGSNFTPGTTAICRHQSKCSMEMRGRSSIIGIRNLQLAEAGGSLPYYLPAFARYPAARLITTSCRLVEARDAGGGGRTSGPAPEKDFRVLPRDALGARP